MQLDGKSSIRGALTAFTVALLGSGAVQAGDGKSIESSFLLYSETNRVQANEGLIGINLPLKGDRKLSARLTVDGLTGASPNGATPSNSIQTFTGPSGNNTYTVNPGDVPFDNTFKDTRYSFNLSYNHPLNRLTTVIIGANLSTEHDYKSIGGNIGLTRDLNRKNTTLSASVAFAHDIVDPVGGAPDPLTALVISEGGEDDEHEDEFEDDDDHGGGSSEGKDVFDAVFGVTQVLGRKTLLRLNYSFNHSSGYLNDPYKYVSIVQNQAGDMPGEPVDYLYESRPNARTKHAVYGELRKYIGGHTIDLSYRYFWDDWGITSHTIDMHYLLPIKAGHALKPHFRYYQQNEADFYRTYLTDNEAIPVNASADYRLGAFHAITVGMQYLFPVGETMHFSLGAEYYRQAGDVSPPESLGILSTTDLFPDMNALVVRVGFSYDF